MSEHNHFVDGLFLKEFSPGAVRSKPNPLLMIHGGSHGWWAFEKWLDFFARNGWKSCAISLRNHSDSYAVPMEQFLRLRVKDYVHDVLRVLKEVEQSPILIGHSMGGIVAQKAAEETDIAALVLVSSVGPGQLGEIRGPLPVDRPVMLEMANVKALWFNHIGEEELDAYYRRMVPESPSVINEYSGGTLHVDREKIQCPVLVVGGQCDRTVVHHPQDVARFYSAQRIMIPDSGHDIMLEPVADAAAAQIEQWLATRVLDSGDGSIA